MRLLIQRVKEASCVIDNVVHSSIKQGYIVYCAYEEKDTFDIIDKALLKVKKLRIFTDSNDKLNLSIDEIDGEVLLISSFSLYGDMLSGNRPSFTRSLKYDLSKPLYDYTVMKAKELFKLSSGVFGADMKIHSINDGPISLMLDI